MALNEVLTVQPAIFSDQLEHAESGGREDASGQLSVMLRGRVDGRVGLLLPDFGCPVSHGQEQVLLLAVLREGLDGPVVGLNLLAEDDVVAELSPQLGVVVSHRLRLL